MADEMVDLFKHTRQQAFVAERDGNYAEALRLWLALEGYIATTPDQEQSGDAIRWRSDLAAHITRLQNLVRSTGGIQQQKIEYRNPTAC